MLRGDTIWSPEGKSFTAHDLGWWQLTCELARDRLQRALQQAAAASQSVASAPDVLLRAADRRGASAAAACNDERFLQNRSLTDDLAGRPGAPPSPVSAASGAVTAQA